MKALIAEGMHYIRSADGLEELYLLKSDPQEQSNVASVSVRLAEPLRRFRAACRQNSSEITPRPVPAGPL